MRIVAGTFRGRSLVAPKGQSTRPTADRARQALFNVLEHAAWAQALDGCRVLDVFAGSGALGLEAMSRGAAYCLFLDRNAAAREAIGANVGALNLIDRIRIDRRDAATLGIRTAGDGAPFDLAFLDPPYGQGLGEAALGRLAAGGWLAAGALVVLERGIADPAPTPDGFQLLDERTWGAARVSFLSPLAP
ncbi:MAG TPA: 16S rRNA (guanine(966)-N(2))-methyltransferase RsmD [Caulobacteraceae bacterium]|nr:16S rRNA (guanine(966)-N(2))-methyltransferase RsmD [Caulobacteraceae bacterium]